MLVVGKQSVVTCKNLVIPYPGAPETSTYTGFILPSAKYDPPGTFRMSTGIRDFPIRVINRDSVIAINDQAVSLQTNKAKDSVRVVHGSGDNYYTVTTQNGRTTCSCPGFQFRKTCRHIEEAK